MVGKSIDSVSGNYNNIAISGSVAVHGYKHLPPPYQLPPLDTFFVGREEEVACLLEQLYPGTIITICGPGGIGKSALAAQVVRMLEASRFPDGILFHSFYHQPSTNIAFQAIAETFQIEEKKNLESDVRQALAGKQALLILDGAEEADDLQAVLKIHGSCGVLITSRRKSDAVAARIDLAPLSAAAAVNLLRAWSGDEEKETIVQRICTILGYHPNAIRVVGRYLGTTGESAAEYLRWLEEEPLKELSCGKHQSENVTLLLRGSVAQVSADARRVMGSVGALALMPVAHDTVVALFDDDERRSCNAINELVNYGLLESQDNRWLESHPLVHTYARNELTLSCKSLKRLATYYINFCETQSKAGIDGYARIDQERAHCLRLIEICLDRRLWQEVKGLGGTMWEYLDRQGYWTEQLTAVEMRLTAAQHTRDRNDECWCLNSLGYTCQRRGDNEQALVWYEQTLPIRRELGDRRGEGVTLNNMAAIYDDQGKHELALDTYQQSLSIQQEISDREGEGTTLNNIGELYRIQGDYEQAMMFYEQSLSIRREVDDKTGEGTNLNNIALIYDTQGKPSKAVEYYKQALVIARELGDRAGEAANCWNLGFTCEKMDDLAQAEEYMSQAVEIAEAIDYPSLEEWREELTWVQAKRQGK